MKSLLISFAFFLAFLNILPLVNGLYYNTWDCCKDPVCSGTATACPSLTSQTPCQRQQDCSWTVISTSCTGTNTFNCAQYTTSTNCNADYRCYWKVGRFVDNPGCAARGCVIWNNNQASCQGTPGCVWNVNYACTGTVTACSSLPSSCINSLGYVQQGCSALPARCEDEGCSKTVTYKSQCTVDQCTVGICRPECGCGCNNNSICDSTETQDKCNADCYTTVSISPNIAAVPGQEVVLTISFNDSRYVAGHIAKYSLTIDGIAWNAENGCNIAGVNVTPTAHQMRYACGWEGKGSDKHCLSTSVNGSLQIETKCNLPYNLVGTTHSLIATPTFYSEETILTGASVTFTTQQKFDLFEWILSFFR